jgi:hypothetical protein
MENYFSFIVPYLQENLTLMLAMGGIFGAVRMIGAVGPLKNRIGHFYYPESTALSQWR